MGGLKDAVEGFDGFFLRSVRALRSCLADFGWTAADDGRYPSVFSILGRLKGMDVFHRSSKGKIGMSPDSVFPLPPVTMSGKLLWSDRDSSMETSLAFHGGNLVLDALNWMHGGGSIRDELSAAHRRVHSRVVDGLLALVMTDEPILSPQGMDTFLRQSQLYSNCGVVLALGVRGGVPDTAADVPLSAHLEEHFPVMAKQVVRPDALLLPSNRRPRRVKRGYTWLSHSYPELVKRNVKVEGGIDGSVDLLSTCL